MGVGIYYFYHGFGLKAFEGRVRENLHANIHVFASRKTLHEQMYASANGQNGANMHKRIH
jgi:hypothetical protein